MVHFPLFIHFKTIILYSANPHPDLHIKLTYTDFVFPSWIMEIDTVISLCVFTTNLSTN